MRKCLYYFPASWLRASKFSCVPAFLRAFAFDLCRISSAAVGVLSGFLLYFCRKRGTVRGLMGCSTFICAFRGVFACAVLMVLPAQILAEDGNLPAPINMPGVRNTFRVTEKLYSGSQPANDAAFATLAKLGVKTIVSVDGARPNLVAAKKHGLRYIHLPIGYDGIPAQRISELAKAAGATRNGAIFVHCHKGKHRGPAAVAVMCEASADWSPEQAEQWLKQAGTAKEYAGLYRSVREFKPVTREQLARVKNLPALSHTPTMVDAMVAIDESFDALKAMQKAGWKTLANQPDRTPVHEATLLWEQLRELSRNDDTKSRPADYHAKLVKSEKTIAILRTRLGNPNPELKALSGDMKSISQSCVGCHKKYRNEK